IPTTRRPRSSTRSPSSKRWTMPTRPTRGSSRRAESSSPSTGSSPHPGLAHYIIHTYDFEPLAERGVAAADKYAKVAPSAPHAQHMPSHIYSILGRWEDSIRSNTAAVKASRDYAAKNAPGTTFAQEPHAQDFMA